MDNTKLVKAFCCKTNKRYGLIVKDFGGIYRVVDMIDMTEEQAKITVSEVKQDSFYTNTNLLACPDCQNRKVSGCDHTRRKFKCGSDSGYNFMCIYCKEFQLDYSLPSSKDLGQYKKGDKVTLAQGKEIKIVTFDNVEWKKFDNIQKHTPGRPTFNEPKIHVLLDDTNIEFHGYNISEMDEGVYYEIGQQDDFDMECDVDTSTILPHPGGNLYINCGIITATIDQYGGSFFLNKQLVKKTQSKFNMRLTVSNGGEYEVFINGISAGKAYQAPTCKVTVKFGFKHDKHYCELLSHAYLKNIKMMQGIKRQ